MEAKHIENLKEGDILKRKSTEEFHVIKQIIPKCSEDLQSNFGFFGFFVKEKIMRKFFFNEGQKILVFNKKN
jgi:hypothetical protein